jgi:hypothetical protein
LAVRRSFVEMEPLVVEQEIRAAFTGNNRWATLAEMWQRDGATEAAAELIQAKLGLWNLKVVVLEVGCVQAFITMLPKTAAMLFVGSATCLELDCHGAVTRTLRTWSSR